jgi:hypothetical protein
MNHRSMIDTQYVCMYYMFRPIVEIMRYTEPLQAPSFLYLPTPASVYTLGVCCTGMFMQYPYVMKSIVY